MNYKKLAIAALGTGAILCAQTPREVREERNVTVTVNDHAVAGVVGDPMRVEVMQVMPFDLDMNRGPVKNSPYSGEGVTEFKQQLSDGNRITRRTVDHVYRDSQGRMRKETTLANVGPWAAGGRKIIRISDPANGTVFVLDDSQKTAQKSVVKQRSEFRVTTDGMAQAGAIAIPDAPRTGAGARTMIFRRSEGPAGAPEAAKMKIRTEDLGKRMVEGVEAIGVRTIETIEAGSMGNERDIEIVSERWGSPELGVTVMSRHSDPRNGETTYTLTNIRRAEPAVELFEVPAEFKVNEMKNFNWQEKFDKVEKK